MHKQGGPAFIEKMKRFYPLLIMSLDGSGSIVDIIFIEYRSNDALHSDDGEEADLPEDQRIYIPDRYLLKAIINGHQVEVADENIVGKRKIDI